jgi:hypothetical protein
VEGVRVAARCTAKLVQGVGKAVVRLESRSDQFNGGREAPDGEPHDSGLGRHPDEGVDAGRPGVGQIEGVLQQGQQVPGLGTGVLLQAPVIVRYRDEGGDARLALEEALR